MPIDKANAIEFVRRYGLTAAYVAMIPLALAMAGMATRLGLGSFRAPGPGMWPLTVSVGLVLAASLCLMEELRLPSRLERLSGRSRYDVSCGVAAVLGYVLLFSNFGWLVATAVITSLWMIMICRSRYLTVLSVTAGLTVSVYGIFVLLLNVQLPG